MSTRKRKHKPKPRVVPKEVKGSKDGIGSSSRVSKVVEKMVDIERAEVKD